MYLKKLGAIFLIGILVWSCSGQQEAEVSDTPYYHSYLAATQAAAEADVPLLVTFYTDT